jgi:hypothetical protein
MLRPAGRRGREVEGIGEVEDRRHHQVGGAEAPARQKPAAEPGSLDDKSYVTLSDKLFESIKNG